METAYFASHTHRNSHASIASAVNALKGPSARGTIPIAPPLRRLMGAEIAVSPCSLSPLRAQSTAASPHSITSMAMYDSTPSLLFYPSYGGSSSSFWTMSPSTRKQQQAATYEANDVSMNFLSPVNVQRPSPLWMKNNISRPAINQDDVLSERTGENSWSSEEVEDDFATTLMLRNVPNKYSRDMLLDEIESRGFLNEIDFFYMPVDLRCKRNVGYCFVNLTSHDGVRRFREAFEGARLEKVPNDKSCQVGVGKVQGLEANIEAYRNNATLNTNEKTRPLLFVNGVSRALPPPISLEKELSRCDSDTATVRTAKTERTAATAPARIGEGARGIARLIADHVDVDWTISATDDEWATTLMLRNVPGKYTRDMMLEELDERGLLNDTDFFYMPIDLRQQRNVGYCFVNLISSSAVRRFREAFEGVSLEKVANDKTCEVGVGKVQGLDANIEAYRNGVIMSMNEKYRPILLVDGVQKPFPAPTLSRKQTRRCKREKNGVSTRTSHYLP